MLSVMGNVKYSHGESMITVTAFENCAVDTNDEEIVALSKDPELGKKIVEIEAKEEAFLEELKAFASKFHDIEKENIKYKMAWEKNNESYYNKEITEEMINEWSKQDIDQ